MSWGKRLNFGRGEKGKGRNPQELAGRPQRTYENKGGADSDFDEKKPTDIPNIKED